MIDEHDLQDPERSFRQNARTSNAEIARQIGMAPSAVLERIRKLEARGVIQGYEARIDPEALGLGLLAFVFVRSDERVGRRVQTASGWPQIPEVQEVHHIAGEDCFLVKVRAADAKALGRLLRERFGASAGPSHPHHRRARDAPREPARLPLRLPAE